MRNVDTAKFEKSIRGRWGASLANSKSGYVTLPNVLLNYYSLLGMSEIELVFILQVMSYKWTSAKPYPSFNTIAHKMGKSRDTVQGYARSLESKRLLKRVQRTGYSSKIDVSPLIQILEEIVPYHNSDRDFIKKIISPYLDPNTKEDSVKRLNKEGLVSIKELVSNKSQISI